MDFSLFMSCDFCVYYMRFLSAFEGRACPAGSRWMYRTWKTHTKTLCFNKVHTEFLPGPETECNIFTVEGRKKKKASKAEIILATRAQREQPVKVSIQCRRCRSIWS